MRIKDIAVIVAIHVDAMGQGAVKLGAIELCIRNERDFLGRTGRKEKGKIPRAEGVLGIDRTRGETALRPPASDTIYSSLDFTIKESVLTNRKCSNNPPHPWGGGDSGRLVSEAEQLTGLN